MAARFASYAAASNCFPANSFKESDGVEAFAAAYGLMCGAGHNLRLILAALRFYFARLGLSMQDVIAALIALSLNSRPACS